MRGAIIFSSSSSDKKIHHSIGMKKPMLTSQQRTLHSQKKEEKEKIIFLMILRALTEFYKEIDPEDICYHSPRNSVNSIASDQSPMDLEVPKVSEDSSDSEEETDERNEMDLNDLVALTIKYLGGNSYDNDETLYSIVKKLVFSFKKSHSF